MIKNSAALIIGISSYQNDEWVLPSSVTKDAKDIHEHTIDPNFCGFDAQNVQLLLDQDASLKEIRIAFKDLILRCNPQTTVLIYFSGHGGHLAHQDGGYLLPTDANSNFTETAISSKEFSGMLGQIPSRKVLIVLDCCHAGGIGTLKDTSKINKDVQFGILNKSYQELASGYGRAILASSRSNEASIVNQLDGNSLFTKHLLKGIKGSAARSDGFIRIHDLSYYVQLQVREESKNLQNPYYRFSGEENFPLAFSSEAKSNGGSKLLSAADEYEFDVYISYLDEGRDIDWVMDELLPLLEDSGLAITDSYQNPLPSTVRVDSVSKGFKLSRRALLIISDNYLKNEELMRENVMFQHIDIRESEWRIIPVYWEDVNGSLIPDRLDFIRGSRLSHPHPRRREQEKQKLLTELLKPGKTQ